MKVTEFIIGILFVLIGILFVLVAALLVAAAYSGIKEADKRMDMVESACAAKHGALMDTSNGFICIGKNGEEL